MLVILHAHECVLVILVSFSCIPQGQLELPKLTSANQGDKVVTRHPNYHTSTCMYASCYHTRKMKLREPYGTPACSTEASTDG